MHFLWLVMQWGAKHHKKFTKIQIKILVQILDTFHTCLLLLIVQNIHHVSTCAELKSDI